MQCSLVWVPSWRTLAGLTDPAPARPSFTRRQGHALGSWELGPWPAGWSVPDHRCSRLASCVIPNISIPPIPPIPGRYLGFRFHPETHSPHDGRCTDPVRVPVRQVVTDGPIDRSWIELLPESPVDDEATRRINSIIVNYRGCTKHAARDDSSQSTTRGLREHY